ncbi:Stp1/IreP family PP2C-type Ser/Thr phosphatase [Microscilla marina]|uniref:Protein phosphatase n=1 Tax=Microscilla marina ATCC 23134 TaxID=313606 RepID=A1ZLP5_MICM2|nr:Stp1/IreP family PP2C-type Ser/Thr phosphatase [Microscilla marina]EAY28799.1 protein phosphatase [Microscilla marina ATCC 23134]
MKNFHFGSHTDIGHVRKQNEDSMGYYETSNGYVFVVCDGMGGAAGGSTASRMAVNSIKTFFQHQYYPNPIEAISQAIQYANQQIFQAAQKAPGMQGMGTTCVLMLVRNDQVYYGHVGDSRLYRLNQGGISRVTKDHSFVQALVDQGVISDEEAETHPRRNELLRALGTQPVTEVEVSFSPIIPNKNDIFLLCTDGLNGLVHDKSIEGTLNSPIDVEHKAIKLVQMANNLGGYDNTTVQLIEFYNLPEKHKFNSGEQKSVLGGTLINNPPPTSDFSDTSSADDINAGFNDFSPEDISQGTSSDFIPSPEPETYPPTPKTPSPKGKGPHAKRDYDRDEDDEEDYQDSRGARKRRNRGSGFRLDIDSPIMQVLGRLVLVIVVFYGAQWLYKYAVKEGIINTGIVDKTKRLWQDGEETINNAKNKYNAAKKRIKDAQDFINSTQKSLNNTLLKLDSLRNKFNHITVQVTEKTKDLKKLAEEQGSKLEWILEVNGLKSADEIETKNIKKLIVPKENPKKVIDKLDDLKQKAQKTIAEESAKLKQ